MKKRDLNDIAYDMSDLTTNFGLLQNYISCLSLKAYEAKGKDDALLIVASLVNEKGLDNIYETIKIANKQINSLVNELADYENGGEKNDTTK